MEIEPMRWQNLVSRAAAAAIYPRAAAAAATIYPRTAVTSLLENPVEATTIVQNFVLLLVENVVWKKYQKEQDWYKKKWKKMKKWKKNGKKKNTRKKGGNPNFMLRMREPEGTPYG
jgi:hypothetical protein